MPETPRILHVDDDDEVRENVAEYLTKEDIPGWAHPEVIGCQSFEEALEKLEAQRFDVVILDVRQGSPEGPELPSDEEAGVQTLDAIVARRFVPIIFWTGLPHQVREHESPLVLVGEKTKGLSELGGLVTQAFGTGLPALNRALLHLVESEQRSYMWGFVSDNWELLRGIDDHTAVAYLLARRLARSISGPGIAALATALGKKAELTLPGGDIHPVEMYVQPPLVNAGRQVGDLLRGEWCGRDSWWLLLTPSCDLANNKVDHVLLAAADPLTEHPKYMAWRQAQTGATEAKLTDLVRQKTGGQDDRWLYLPEAISVPDLVVDMQQLISVPLGDLGAFSHIASLDSPFAESAVNRFGRYYGRIGTPDFDASPVLERLEAAL